MSIKLKISDIVKDKECFYARNNTEYASKFFKLKAIEVNDDLLFLRETEIGLPEGSGLPTNLVPIANFYELQAIEHSVLVFDIETKKWKLTGDFRGVDVYSKETGHKVEIKEIGDLPDTDTLIPPPSIYHTFDETTKTWILTEEGKKQQKTAEVYSLINEYQSEISDIKSTIMLLDEKDDAEQIKTLKARYKELIKLIEEAKESLIILKINV